MKEYPKELIAIQEKDQNMGNFIPLLYSVAKDYRYQHKGVRKILEIGVRGGISTNAFLYGLRDRDVKHPSQKLYSVDIEDCSNVVSDNTLKEYWEFILGDSKTIPWKDNINILLIDGDHSYEGCLADYKRFEPFVVEGGLILMHDMWPHKAPFKVFWDEVPYPKTILPLSKSSLGMAFKIFPPYYDNNIIKLDHKG